MTTYVREVGWRRLTVVLLVALACGRVAIAQEAKSPSAEEKKAVALLSEKGAVIFIDGDYQVTQILGGRELSNDDLKHIRVFKKLKTLSLSSTKIDDESVEILKTLSQLQALNLSSGVLSNKSRDELKKSLPNCRIVAAERRDGRPGGASGQSSPNSASRGPWPPAWGAFEYPPLSPSPSITDEIRISAVQDHLKLSSEQKSEINRVTGRDFQRRQSEDAVKKVLTAEQKALLKQVLL